MIVNMTTWRYRAAIKRHPNSSTLQIRHHHVHLPFLVSRGSSLCFLNMHNLTIYELIRLGCGLNKPPVAIGLDIWRRSESEIVFQLKTVMEMASEGNEGGMESAIRESTNSQT